MNMNYTDVMLVIERAINEEREECAKLLDAEALRISHTTKDPNPEDQKLVDTLKAQSQAIRDRGVL